jgi:LmbE family N-acetylglucosaminyl deacetylase
MKKPRFSALPLLLGLLARVGSAQAAAPPLLDPDARYKADVLLIVAHPDDDVVIGGYLARITADEHKRVAVVYCTNGDGGGNNVGNESGVSLGLIREMEARRALGRFGIENIWFLGGHDTPGQNVLRSLDHWNHGLMLDQVVRLVRITRPDVILTWLPDPVVGENHEDHQASGVLAVEAFDAAGDATRFPEQVSPPRDRTGMANLTEGLMPWQPKKLYFFTDAFEVFNPYWHDKDEVPTFRKNLVDGTGPSYDNATTSPARRESYAHLMAEQQSYYQTQEGEVGDNALKSGQFAGFEYPMHLIFGKSLVGGSVAGDVFEGVRSMPIAFTRVRGYEADKAAAPLSFVIGDPWRFYAEFWKAHDLDRLAALNPIPEVEAERGGLLTLDFVACNRTSNAADFTIASKLPEGWSDATPFGRYPVKAGQCYPIQRQLRAPAAAKAGWQELKWSATDGSQKVSDVLVRVYVGKSGGLPQ